jgi:hypothetical protein
VERETLVRPWALGVLALVFNAPLASRIVFDTPFWPAISFVALLLAVAIPAVWLVPGLRRAAFVPDAAERGAAGQVAGASLGMVAVAVFAWILAPELGW